MKERKIVQLKMKEAIENLYKVFSKYKVDTSIEGCPCCVNDKHKKLLLSRPLRELEHDQIGRYSFKAMTTWGNTRNYKYYLPRILELLVLEQLIYDEFVTFGKLDYANWLKWDIIEINALKQLFEIWPEYNIRIQNYINDEVWFGVLKKGINPKQLFKSVEINNSDESFNNFIVFFTHNYNTSLKKNLLKAETIDNITISLFDDWINCSLEILEQKIKEGYIQDEKERYFLEWSIKDFKKNK